MVSMEHQRAVGSGVSASWGGALDENSSKSKRFIRRKGVWYQAGRGLPRLAAGAALFQDGTRIGDGCRTWDLPCSKLLPRSGVEAVVNADIVTLSAQIDGEVQTGPSILEIGTSFARGDVLLHITNERADRSRADDLAREIQRLTDDRPGIEARLADARMRLADLTEQMRIFKEARTLQLEARQDELDP